MIRAFLIAITLVAALTLAKARTPAQDPPRPVRIASIGGMGDTGFWEALGPRFEKATGRTLEVTAMGPKSVIARAFREGEADFISMHAGDAIINLVADGYALDPQPWMRNDIVIIGPAADPAGVRGETDAVAALRKIAASPESRFVIHSSLGAQEVLRELLEQGGIALDPARTTTITAERHREAVAIAAKENAYTLLGRIPFLSGKLPPSGLVLMVRGDPRLRRPYVLATANPARFPGADAAGAAALAAFLRQKDTQAWIAEFGKGRFDDGPLFFPVQVND